MSKVFYIGRFTPKTGGVTVKNNLTYDTLRERTEIEKIDLTQLKKGHIPTLFRTLYAVLGKGNRVIIGTAQFYRRVFSCVLYWFNRNAMNQSILLVMGGMFGTDIAKDKRYQKWAKEYGRIYVETQKMKKQLSDLGFSNVVVFPNCRKRPAVELLVTSRQEQLKCVCFSMIYPEKGIDVVLEAASSLPNVSFEFWGAINPEYERTFLESIEKRVNCKYNGVFHVKGDNVYQLLNTYDLLLFPTRCQTEGVPGTLVEAKIAGVPAVVSNVAYNAELVEAGVSGLVLEEANASCLVEAIKRIDGDDALLTKLKRGAQKSGEMYYFDSYVDEMMDFFLKEDF